MATSRPIIGAIASALGYVPASEISSDEQQITALQSQITALESQNSTYSAKISSLNNEISSLDTEISTLSGQVSSLQSELASETSSYNADQSKIATLTSSISSLSTQINNLQSQLASDVSQINTLESTISANNMTIQGLRQQLSSLGSELTADQRQITALTSELNEFRSELAQYKTLAEYWSEIASEYNVSTPSQLESYIASLGSAGSLLSSLLSTYNVSSVTDLENYIDGLIQDAYRVNAAPTYTLDDSYLPITASFFSNVATDMLAVGSSAESHMVRDPSRGWYGNRSARQYMVEKQTVPPSQLSGLPVSVTWNFGDGNSAQGSLSSVGNVTHMYTSPGTYTPTCTVSVTFNGKNYTHTFALPSIVAKLRPPSRITMTWQGHSGDTNYYLITVTSSDGKPSAYSPIILTGVTVKNPAERVTVTDVYGQATAILVEFVCGTKTLTVTSLLDPTVSVTLSGQPPC